MKFNELDDAQRLNLVESDQLYRAWYEARTALEPYRYAMRWVNRGEKRYLVRFIDARGNGRSQGPESEITHALLARFEDGRARARARYDGLSERLAIQARLNRALRIGRLPRAVADILGALTMAGLDKEFLIVGTHALFAYETMAAVHVSPDALASGDLDLCFDARRPLRLAMGKLDRHQTQGLLGLLQKVDKTYAPMRAEGVFRAVNAQGFMVDLITAERSMRESSPVTFGEGDLVAAEVANLHWLINAPRTEVVVIAANGRPLLMRVPDPRAFALHKAWLSQQPSRDPVKRRRDQSQAEIVVTIVGRYLPDKPFSPEHLRFLSLEMIGVASRALPHEEGDEDFLRELRESFRF